MSASPWFADVTPARIDGYHPAVTPDATFVEAAIKGDASAFGALMDRHARVCLRYATRMLGNVEDAEDATQETFIRAHRALARYDGSVAFRTWLMTILINRCRTALDSRRRHHSRVVSDPDACDRAQSPARDDDMVLRDAIERALARLEAPQREAFLLKHVEQLSYEEMMRITGAGVSALKMRVQRACERLQLLLAEDRNHA